ncbi:hypothetical protein SELMODRAFT_113032 [Selaginella moellendorffii]|uniref:Uncharacterized protein n=1 Tax=Selaginella moellendorffii TaxID=88036 RepID=D8SBA0_SELML|nr:thiamine phosphate phosphatase-like protein [Selaginella moellendorffii]EFJ18355.1 hypothetical protein SELMODRAFT_113032 [Selaginella moellendorffii]|eukprot:XP_002980704.1 thiamine phosphate phosphatase-like protein [Selaginella moellendorffii]
MASSIVVFDFDWSLINCNSDTFVVEQMGASDLMRSLRRSLPWTDLMDTMMVEIMSRGRTLAEIEASLRTIPLDSSMSRAIRAVAAAGYELQIISDANTLFIQTILDNFNLTRFFSEIHTNPASLDDHGLLRVRPYQSSEVPHGCLICPPNMCKGLILDRILSSKPAENRVVYIGDGRGDICPSLRLKVDDHLLARVEFPLAKHIENNREIFKANLHLWSSPKDIENHLLDILDLRAT